MQLKYYNEHIYYEILSLNLEILMHIKYDNLLKMIFILKSYKSGIYPRTRMPDCLYIIILEKKNHIFVINVYEPC